MPIKCPKCDAKPGVFVFKYSMEKHYQTSHPTHNMPEEFAVSAEEKQHLAPLWTSIQRNKPQR